MLTQKSPVGFVNGLLVVKRIVNHEVRVIGAVAFENRDVEASGLLEDEAPPHWPHADIQSSP